MISPTEIRKKALRSYPTFLSAILTRERFFPLHIRGNKGKATDAMETLYPTLRRLLENEKKKLGYGYTVTLKSVNTRHAGTISMPDEIYFENVEDYLKFIEKEKEFLAFRKAVQKTKKALPDLLNWMGNNPMKVVKNLEKWGFLLKIGLFFKENSRPNLYARALPIDVPTVFIEENQGILIEILEVVLPPESISKKEEIFEKKFGLKYDEPVVRVRILDVGIGDLFDKNIDVSLSISDWNLKEIQAEWAYLISDKMDFLRFPNKNKSVAIWVNESNLQSLFELKFLHSAEVYFWGNISVASFQKLSDIRTKLPNVKSFCMHSTILETYKENVEEVKVKNDGMISNLTIEENEVLKKLMERKQLLSKHIKQKDLYAPTV